MNVCMRVCMYVCMYEDMYVCMFVMYVCIYVCMYEDMYLMYVRKYVCMYAISLYRVQFDGFGFSRAVVSGIFIGAVEVESRLPFSQRGSGHGAEVRVTCTTGGILIPIGHDGDGNGHGAGERATADFFCHF